MINDHRVDHVTVPRLGRVVLRSIVSLILALAIPWAAAALWIDGPEFRVLAGTLPVGLVLIAATAAVLGPTLAAGRGSSVSVANARDPESWPSCPGTARAESNSGSADGREPPGRTPDRMSAGRLRHRGGGGMANRRRSPSRRASPMRTGRARSDIT